MTDTTDTAADDTTKPGTVRAWFVALIALYVYFFVDSWVISKRGNLYVYAGFLVAVLVFPGIYEAKLRGRQRVAKVLQIITIGTIVAVTATLLVTGEV